MALTFVDLKTRVKQVLGNRTHSTSSITVDDTWYGERVNSAYRAVCTFQGLVTRPGARQPQFRILRFFELENRTSRTLTTVLTSNFVTPSMGVAVAYMQDIWDVTNARGMRRVSRREILGLNPNQDGTPRNWCPAGSAGVNGYYINPRPQTSTYNITVYEYTYNYPTALTSVATPIIPDEWHPCIWMKAAEEGAALLGLDVTEGEMRGAFKDYIAERKSPAEDSAFSGLAGPRRSVTVGGV